MSALILQDEAYKAIFADPELERARKKLSLHEIRLIVNHVRANPPIGKADHILKGDQ